jgi:Fur family transcriptional regulator, zinc uptake regulator
MADHTDDHSHHDHSHHHAHHGVPLSPAAVLDAALSDCERRGLKLTDQRRDALKALAAAGKPMGAYDILASMTDMGYKKLAPVTVYRALDFLLEAGLVHRLASLNAFVLCPHRHDKNDVVVFLICDECKRVEEASSEAIRHDLSDLASRHHFLLKGQVLEMAGQCTACRSQPSYA